MEQHTGPLRSQRTLVVLFLAAFCCTFPEQAAGAYGNSYVLEVTHMNFHDVIGNEQGVLLEFYAPWCKYCKRLTPIYELVGQAFEKEKRVIIAKIDGTVADHTGIKEQFQVEGFPKLLWFPPNTLTPMLYTGDRYTQDITDFVNEQAGTKVALKGPAAQASRIPTLTAEAKQRAKERFMRDREAGGGGGQYGMPTQPSPAQPGPGDDLTKLMGRNLIKEEEMKDAATGGDGGEYGKMTKEQRKAEMIDKLRREEEEKQRAASAGEPPKKKKKTRKGQSGEAKQEL